MAGWCLLPLDILLHLHRYIVPSPTYESYQVSYSTPPSNHNTSISSSSGSSSSLSSSSSYHSQSYSHYQPYSYNYSWKCELNWRAFLNTNKQLFHECKLKTIYYSLNKYYSIQYLIDSEFRNQFTHCESQQKVPKFPSWQFTTSIVSEFTNRLAPNKLFPGLTISSNNHNNHNNTPANRINLLPPRIWKVENPRKQLGLDFSYTSLLFSDFQLLQEVFQNLHYLNLSYTKITNEALKYLQNIHYLSLKNCLEITRLPLPLNMMDAREGYMKGIDLLDLSGCINIQNYESLLFQKMVQGVDEEGEFPWITRLECNNNVYKMYHLNLSFSLQIELNNYLYLFNHIYSLNLSKCENLVDISMLSHIYYLNLSGCIRITDVSSLGNVKILDLSHCIGIHDITPLISVSCLFLYNCPNIQLEGVKNLSNIYELHVSRKNIVDLSLFSKISKLCLAYCHQIIYPSPIVPIIINQEITPKDPLIDNYLSSSQIIRNLQEITLDHCESIVNLSCLENIPSISIRCCDKIDDIHVLKNVKSLTLLGCERISAFSFAYFKQLIHLSISFCHGIAEIDYYIRNCSFSLPTPDLSTAAGSSSINNGMKTFSLSYCDGVNKMKIYNDLQSLNINDCTNLNTLDIYGHVQVLDLKYSSINPEPEINILGLVQSLIIEEIQLSEDLEI